MNKINEDENIISIIDAIRGKTSVNLPKYLQDFSKPPKYVHNVPIGIIINKKIPIIGINELIELKVLIGIKVLENNNPFGFNKVAVIISIKLVLLLVIMFAELFFHSLNASHSTYTNLVS
ncbi:hypothetical protein ID855_20855 [Xenorhabdus sp. ZM]|uniref:hypothetical protein n=1 Tax=Xenorhabdus szentirmaii TaxID=290112 RepID=UPI0019C625A9|nr:hypothetical protein [Xenorhabdus sp. ZM]MBD2807066.1 hypothetical protein [Xenorhabdus sp. ZM]